MSGLEAPEVSRDGWIRIYDTGGFLAATVPPSNLAEEEARRIVASYNALIDVPVEEIEGAIGRLVGSVQDLRDEVDKYDLKATGNLRQVFAALAAFEKVSEKGRER